MYACCGFDHLLLAYAGAGGLPAVEVHRVAFVLPKCLPFARGLERREVALVGKGEQMAMFRIEPDIHGVADHICVIGFDHLIHLDPVVAVHRAGRDDGFAVFSNPFVDECADWASGFVCLADGSSKQEYQGSEQSHRTREFFFKEGTFCHLFVSRRKKCRFFANLHFADHTTYDT